MYIDKHRIYYPYAQFKNNIIEIEKKYLFYLTKITS